MATATHRRLWAPIAAASAASISVVHCFTCAVSSASSPSLRGGRTSVQARSAPSAVRAAVQRLSGSGAALLGTAGVLSAFAHVAGARRRQLRISRSAAAENDAKDEGAADEEGAAAEPKASAPAKKKAGQFFAPRKGPNVFDPRNEIGAVEPLGFWDPVGICPKDETVFNEYRACELKHGRVAMMAALGAVAQHYIRFPGFTLTNFGKPLPAGLGAVSETPGSFGFVVLLAFSGVLEIFFWKDGIDVTKGRWTKEPGNFGDPLGLGQYNEDMRNRELNNGRFAMFAAIGIIVAELLTGKDAVQQLGL